MNTEMPQILVGNCTTQQGTYNSITKLIEIHASQHNYEYF